jgi:hypothetical protein
MSPLSRPCKCGCGMRIPSEAAVRAYQREEGPSDDLETLLLWSLGVSSEQCALNLRFGCRPLVMSAEDQINASKNSSSRGRRRQHPNKRKEARREDTEGSIAG